MFAVEFPCAGDARPFDLFDQPLLAVRGSDGRLRIFHNIVPHFHRRARSLITEAGKEGLALHQSAAYEYWHDQTRYWAREVRRVLGREGPHGEVLADGSKTARGMAEAMAAFEKIRKAHGPPDDSVRMERRREERKQEQSRSRGRGFSM